MEALPITNEVAVPISVSEVPTERIFARDRRRPFQIGSTQHARFGTAYTISKRNLIGLCSVTSAFGILLTWTVNRPWQARAPRPLETGLELHRPPSPPSPLPALLVEPIPSAPAPSLLDAPPPSRDAVGKPHRDVRIHGTRVGQTKRPAPEPPEPAPLAPPPPKAWVDPFAD
jgi:hypothetical protein